MITERFDDVESVFSSYLGALKACEVPFEIIYVIDGDYPEVLSTLKRLQLEHSELKLLVLPRSFGEATAISLGAEHSGSDWIITLPAYLQVESAEIPRLFAMRESSDMIIARRITDQNSSYNRLQTRVFNWLASAIGGLDLKDSGCNVRLFRRSMLKEVQLYGDLHRFLPLLAHRQGFSVREMRTKQAEQNRKRRVYSPGLYMRRLLDLLAIYFLIRFTKKPFRFFGLIGSAFTLVGGVLMAWIAAERLFLAQDLADRPMLVLASLLLVFGLQIISVGLLGEIIIFSHAKDLKEYTVAKVIESSRAPPG